MQENDINNAQRAELQHIRYGNKINPVSQMNLNVDGIHINAFAEVMHDKDSSFNLITYDAVPQLKERKDINLNE